MQASVSQHMSMKTPEACGLASRALTAVKNKVKAVSSREACALTFLPHGGLCRPAPHSEHQHSHISHTKKRGNPVPNRVMILP